MSGFFESYFEALDGPDSYSALRMVGVDLQFAILFATEAGGDSHQSVGGADELAAYMDARDPQGWRHHLLGVVAQGDVELALGETRYPDGTVAGTFLCAARLDPSGNLERYLVGRSPGVLFPAPT